MKNANPSYVNLLTQRFGGDFGFLRGRRPALSAMQENIKKH
jgi:hypothetical protein